GRRAADRRPCFKHTIITSQEVSCLTTKSCRCIIFLGRYRGDREPRFRAVPQKESVMPAVTVDNILTLPKIPAHDPAHATLRELPSITTAPSGFEGEGFPVRRGFAGVAHADLDPFVHLDQMGEVEYAPGEAKGTPWHPHRGFETVTYMIDGTFEHQDSNGGGGVITNGDTQ